MLHKKIYSKLLLVLASATLLGACSQNVTATLRAEDAKAPLIQNIGTVVNNDLEEIYDALVSSSSANSEKVKNNVLVALAEGHFGSFYDVLNEDSSVKKVGLLSIVKKTDQEIFDWGKNREPYKVDGEENVVRYVKDFYESVINRINESFFGEITNTSYQKRGAFLEEKFFEAKANELYKLTAPATFKEPQPVDGFDKKEDAPKYFSDYLNTYKDYIERAILPGIYRKALVEEYIYERNYSDLGRSYARRVEFISLPDIDGKPSATQDLVNAYAKKILTSTDVNLAKYKDFRYLDLLFKGYFEDIDAEENKWAKDVYKEAGWTLNDFGGALGSPLRKAYSESKYGILAKDYNDVSDSRWKDAGTDFTDSGKHVKEVGLEVKTRSIIAGNNVTEGWFDSSGLSSLSSDIRTRLFKIQVANEVDTINYEKQDDGSYVEKKNVKGNFGWYVEGDYYMVPAKFPEAQAYPFVIHEGTSTFMVKVNEAVNSQKLAKDGTNNYKSMAAQGRRKAGAPTQHEIIAEVTKLKSDSSSNEKAAYKFYLQKAVLEFHDTTLYNYFVEQFPDLF
ncbi:MAG: hypothetical protein SPL02_01445 [Bacilli bacterium]|nr:hypothetical protein [Bacilli bacterium]MDY6430535.1 hypothetical protein [Bacilli bacterium]